MSTMRDKPVRASRLTTLSDIEALRDEWRQLEGCCPDLTPFSTWEWCNTVAKYNSRSRPFWCFTFRDNDDLVGIAPFAETCFSGLRLLRFIGSMLGRSSIADYQDLLAADGREDEVAGCLCDELMRQRAWDVLQLQELPSSSRMVDALLKHAGSRGWLTQLKPGSDVHLIHTDGVWDDYRAILSRRSRRLMARPEASFITIANDEGAVLAAMEELFDLHTRRWKSIGMPGIFDTEQRRCLYREIAAQFARRGMLRISLLRCEDQTVAINLGFMRNDMQYHYSLGLNPDPKWARFHFGLMLNLLVMKDAFERGVRCVDWLRGDGHYKKHLRTEEHFNQELLVFRNRRTSVHYRFAYYLRRIARSSYKRLQRSLATERKYSPKPNDDGKTRDQSRDVT